MENFLPSEQTFTNPFFIGTVEDNNDPTNNYRIKVRIKELHQDSISTANLPWAAKVDSAFMGMSDNAPLSHNVPEVGSQVLLIAVGNDPNSLLYIGILYHKTPQTPSGDSYGGSYGIYMSGGQFVGIDKVTKTFQMIYEGHINIDKILDGKLTVSNKLDVICPKTNIIGDINITGNVHVTGNIISDTEVTAKTVNLTTHTHTYAPGDGDPTSTSPGVG